MNNIILACSIFTLTLLGAFAIFDKYICVPPKVVKVITESHAPYSPDCNPPKDFPGISKKLSEITPGKSGYFPKNIFDKRDRLDDFVNDWYETHLKAMDEKPLITNDNAGSEIYRFLWLRSFHHPVSIRVEINVNGPMLHFKELGGAGGYEPGKPIKNISKKITQTEWCGFINKLKIARYWTMFPMHKTQGLDGAEWVLEGVKDGRYHLVSRWSPNNGNYRNACIYLLHLAGYDTSKRNNIY